MSAAHPLAELGYRVFGVDDSPEMLTHLRGVESRRARIEDVRLDRRFGGVPLASHLINVPSPVTRRALLSTGAHHLADDGRLLIEWHPPTWFDTVADGQGGSLGELDVRIENVLRDGDLLSATVRYTLADRSWTQPFTARRLTEPDMHAELSAAGLAFDGWCTPERTWFAARSRHQPLGENTPQPAATGHKT